MRSPSSKRSFKWHAPFLSELCHSGSVVEAARTAGVSRKTAYWHRRIDADLALNWDAAVDAFYKRRLGDSWDLISANDRERLQRAINQMN